MGGEEGEWERLSGKRSKALFDVGRRRKERGRERFSSRVWKVPGLVCVVAREYGARRESKLKSTFSRQTKLKTTSMLKTLRSTSSSSLI